MLPITSPDAQRPLPDRSSLDALRVKDAYLRDVLEGRAYLVFDGAMGTMLQAHGLAAGEIPDLLSLTEPEAVTAIHRAYVEAGSMAVTTNTFGTNARKLAGAVGSDGSAATVDAVFAAAIDNARASGARYVAADIGPLGELLEPMGSLTLDEAYELFAEQARAAEAHGADIVIIETMANLLEMKAAVLAAKESTSLPIFATMTFAEGGRTFLGTSAPIAAEMLASLGVQALGVNCSLGPVAIAPIIAQILEVAPCPVIVQANAGLPKLIDGVSVYSVKPDEYIEAVRPIIAAGATVIGGCCGTSPDYIKLIAAEIAGAAPSERSLGASPMCTSATKAVELDDIDELDIGTAINPENEDLIDAFLEGEIDDILDEVFDMDDDEVDIIAVNVGAPFVDEVALLPSLVKGIQGISATPLLIESDNPAALEAAVRVYSGKPLVCSTADEAAAIAAHYGCATQE